MAKRKRFIKQTEIGLFDKSARLQQVQSMENTLKQTSLIMDCEIFLPVLDRIPTAVPKGPGGRPPFHPCSCSRFLFCSPSKAFPTNRPNIRFSTAADTVPDQNTIRGFRETLTRSEVTDASVLTVKCWMLSPVREIPRHGWTLDVSEPPVRKFSRTKAFRRRSVRKAHATDRLRRNKSGATVRSHANAAGWSMSPGI